MFNKSLWFILLTILGGFFFYSPSASADYFLCGSSASTRCSDNHKKATFTNPAQAMSCSLFGGIQTNYIPNTRRTQCSGGFAPTWYYVSTSNSDSSEPFPFDETGQCVPDTEFGMCQPEEDWDNDGTPNFQDEDSPAYDPDYCSSNPLSQYACEDDGSGDDDGGDDGSGGGNDGGGDGGSGWQPPVGSECNYQTDSESCCYDYAQYYCQDEGGIATWGYVSIGAQECNVTCNNQPDDGSDPGDDGGSGDDGSGDQTDNSDVVNAINQLKDSNITEFGQFKDALDSLVTETSQQTNDLVNAQQNNTETLSGDINTLNNTNQTGFDSLSAQLEDIKNNTAQSSDGLTNQLLQAIRDDTTGIFSSLGDLNQSQFETNRSLDELNESVSGIGDALNTDRPLPSEGDFGSGDFGGEAAGNGIGDALNDRFGDMPGIPNEVVNLSEGSYKFKPILPDVDSACPEPMVMDFGVTKVSLSWGPFCDLFSLIGILVIASASLAVPFIILGVSKK